MSDAREQLRRYLEQRRDMGESELVLDSLTVEEALRLIGVKAGRAGQAGVGGQSQSSSRQQNAVAIERTPERNAKPADERASEVRRDEPLSGPADPAIDWREALRATGAFPEEIVKKKVGRFEFPAGATGTDTAATGGHGSESAPAAASGLSAVTPASELLGGVVAGLDTLEKIAAHVASCTRCPLFSTATNPVPGEGNPNADLMCVGEAPGATEDQTGRPFVGAAGQLLTKILEAIQLSREQVYIANVLKHRPPGNRNPLPEEVTACSPYLIRQIELVKPKVIIALGTFAAQTLLGSQLSLGKLRGQIHRFHGVPLIVTYHPAALLRNPSWKRPTWEDVQLARRILDSAQPGA